MQKINFFWKFCLDLPVILARISGDPPESPRGGSPGGLWTISAGPHGTRKGVDENPLVFFNISNVHFWYKMLPLDYSEILGGKKNSNN